MNDDKSGNIVNWPELYDQCLAILQRHTFYPDALTEIKQKVDSRIDAAKLRDAFRRGGYRRPKDYVLDNLVKPAAELAVAARPKAEDGLGMSKPNQKNLLARQGISFTPELEEAVRAHLEDHETKRELRRAAKDISTQESQFSDWIVKQKLAQQHLAIAPRNLRVQLPTLDTGTPTLILPLNDIHVGKKSAYKKASLQYNLKIAYERLQVYLSIVEAKRQQGNWSYDTNIVIACLGDVFESLLGNMRAGQGIGLESSGFEQYQETRDLLLWFCRSLSSYKSVSLYLIGGNHDRLTPERDPNSEDMMMQMLGESLAEKLALVPGAKWSVVACEPIQSLELPYSELIMQHGHRTRNVNENASRRLIETHGKTMKRKLLIQGHYHSFRVESGKNWRSVTLPAICGSDDWSSFNLMRENPAETVFFLSTKRDDEIYGPFRLED